MKQKILFIFAVLLLAGCEKPFLGEVEDEVVINDDSKKKKFTFTLKGEFEKSILKSQTRGYLQTDGQNLTDLWVFDYMDGKLVQSLHQIPTDDTWGTPQMSLAYGSHHVYFVAARGNSPLVNEDLHTIEWETPKDAFWKDYEVEVVSTSNGNRAVTLDRIATKLKLTINDKVPEGCAAVNVTPDKWYYGIDYVTGQPVNNKKQTRTVNIPSSYIGTSGQLAISIFGLSGSDEWVTNVSVTATDSDSKVLGSVNISGAPFKANRSTEYSGNLFGSSGGLDVSINSEWESPKIGTW